MAFMTFGSKLVGGRGHRSKVRKPYWTEKAVRFKWGTFRWTGVRDKMILKHPFNLICTMCLV